jgi:hypothetical protein
MKPIQVSVSPVLTKPKGAPEVEEKVAELAEALKSVEPHDAAPPGSSAPSIALHSAVTAYEVRANEALLSAADPARVQTALTSLTELAHQVPLRKASDVEKLLILLSGPVRDVSEAHWEARVPGFGWSLANYELADRLSFWAGRLPEETRDKVQTFAAELKAVAKADLRFLESKALGVSGGFGHLSNLVSSLDGKVRTKEPVPLVLDRAARALESAAKKTGRDPADAKTLQNYALSLREPSRYDPLSDGEIQGRWMIALKDAFTGSASFEAAHVDSAFLERNPDVAPLILGLKDTGRVFDIASEVRGLYAATPPSKAVF